MLHGSSFLLVNTHLRSFQQRPPIPAPSQPQLWGLRGWSRRRALTSSVFGRSFNHGGLWDERVRNSQVRELTAQVDDYVGRCHLADAPVLLAGDFNGRCVPRGRMWGRWGRGHSVGGFVGNLKGTQLRVG